MDIQLQRSNSNMGAVDYNSWVESDKGRRLAASLDKDVVLAEGSSPARLLRGRSVADESSIGYKQYDTGRKHMARMGDWRNNKDEEIALDGIGGVNILVKADVHRSGKQHVQPVSQTTTNRNSRNQLPLLCVRKPSRDGGLRQDG